MIMSNKSKANQLVLNEQWREFFQQTAQVFSTLIELVQSESFDNPIVWALDDSFAEFSVPELAEKHHLWLPDMPKGCNAFVQLLSGTALLGWQLRKLRFPENTTGFTLKIPLPALAQQDVHKQKQNKILETIARFTLCFFMLAEGETDFAQFARQMAQQNSDVLE